MQRLQLIVLPVMKEITARPPRLVFHAMPRIITIPPIPIMLLRTFHRIVNLVIRKLHGSLPALIMMHNTFQYIVENIREYGTIVSIATPIQVIIRFFLVSIAMSITELKPMMIIVKSMTMLITVFHAYHVTLRGTINLIFKNDEKAIFISAAIFSPVIGVCSE